MSADPNDALSAQQIADRQAYAAGRAPSAEQEAYCAYKKFSEALCDVQILNPDALKEMRVVVQGYRPIDEQEAAVVQKMLDYINVELVTMEVTKAATQK